MRTISAPEDLPPDARPCIRHIFDKISMKYFLVRVSHSGLKATCLWKLFALPVALFVEARKVTLTECAVYGVKGLSIELVLSKIGAV